MPSIRLKSSGSKKRSQVQKRGSASWRIETTLRRFWSNTVLKFGIVAGLAFAIPALLWWAEYPQKLGNFMLHSLISTTGRLGFSLSDVFVEGRHNAPIQTILNAVNIKRGNPLLSYDPYQIKQQLEDIPWIRQATVKRQLPNIIFIQLVERQPVALWQHQQRHYLVDEQGIVISDDKLQAFDKLPIIVGRDAPMHAPQILRLLNKFPEIRAKITALVRVGERRWDMHLDRTIQIKLPETGIEEALVKLDLLIKQKKVNAKEVSMVDLRVKNQMVMRLSPAAAMRLKGKGKET